MVQLTYRRAKSAPDFVPGGATQNDFTVRFTHRLKNALEVSVFGQVEFWKAPILAEGLHEDTAFGLELTVHPRWTLGK
jgi:hypothetical protein